MTQNDNQNQTDISITPITPPLTPPPTPPQTSPSSETISMNGSQTSPNNIPATLNENSLNTSPPVASTEFHLPLPTAQPQQTFTPQAKGPQQNSGMENSLFQSSKPSPIPYLTIAIIIICLGILGYYGYVLYAGGPATESSDNQGPPNLGINSESDSVLPQETAELSTPPALEFGEAENPDFAEPQAVANEQPVTEEVIIESNRLPATTDTNSESIDNSTQEVQVSNEEIPVSR